MIKTITPRDGSLYVERNYANLDNIEVNSVWNMTFNILDGLNGIYSSDPGWFLPYMTINHIDIINNNVFVLNPYSESELIIFAT